jgi:hypothetical protein
VMLGRQLIAPWANELGTALRKRQNGRDGVGLVIDLKNLIGISQGARTSLL